MKDWRVSTRLYVQGTHIVRSRGASLKRSSRTEVNAQLLMTLLETCNIPPKYTQGHVTTYGYIFFPYHHQTRNKERIRNRGYCYGNVYADELVFVRFLEQRRTRYDVVLQEVGIASHRSITMYEQRGCEGMRVSRVCVNLQIL